MTRPAIDITVDASKVAEACARLVAKEPRTPSAKEIAETMTPATDCLTCPKCAMPCGAPALTHANCHDASSDDMCCRACGHQWLEEDIEKCMQAWRAEVEYEKGLRRACAEENAGTAKATLEDNAAAITPGPKNLEVL